MLSEEEMERRDNEILEKLGEELRAGLRDGSVHLNPAPPEYLADVFPEDYERPQRAPSAGPAGEVTNH